MLETELKLENPIFIVGCPRSGTSKLASILNRHSKISSSSETHFFDIISKKNFKWQTLDESSFNKILEESRIKDFIELGKINSKELKSEFISSKKSKKDLFNIFCKSFLKGQEKSRICETTPQHIFHLKEILEIFPEAKFIMVYRDGRDTVSSLLKMPWRPKGVLNNAKFWIDYIDYGMQLEKTISNKNLISVNYENLMEDTELLCSRICEFLQESYEGNMVNGVDQGEALYADWEASWKHKSQESIDASRIGSWQRELAEDDQKILEHILFPYLKKLGYETKKPKLGFRLSVRLTKAYLEFYWRALLRFITNAI